MLLVLRSAPYSVAKDKEGTTKRSGNYLPAPCLVVACNKYLVAWAYQFNSAAARRGGVGYTLYRHHPLPISVPNLPTKLRLSHLSRTACRVCGVVLMRVAW